MIKLIFNHNDIFFGIGVIANSIVKTVNKFSSSAIIETDKANGGI